MRNICIEVATAELRACGLAYKIARGGKHPRVLWSSNGVQRFFVVSASASDWRAAKNARAGIRRLLREEGLLA
jgi:hypothetical protein